MIAIDVGRRDETEDWQLLFVLVILEASSERSASPELEGDFLGTKKLQTVIIEATLSHSIYETFLVPSVNSFATHNSK